MTTIFNCSTTFGIAAATGADASTPSSDNIIKTTCGKYFRAHCVKRFACSNCFFETRGWVHDGDSKPLSESGEFLQKV